MTVVKIRSASSHCCSCDEQVPEPLERGQVGRVELVRAPVARERLVALAELLGDVALPVGLAAELLRVALERERLDHGVEDALCVRPARLRDVDVGERARRVGVTGGALQRLLVVARRLIAVVALLVVDAARGGVEAGLLRRVGRVARLLDEHLQEPIAIPLALGDPLQRADRRQAARVELHRPRVRLLRAPRDP